MGSTGEYWVGDTIGEGSFGTVVFGLHKTRTNLKVAIKVVDKTSLRKNVTQAKGVVGEQRILKALKSTPCVVDLYASFHDDHCVYLVMEACPWNLSQVTVTEETTRPVYAYQLVEAVYEIHKLGVVHCDVSPNNILVTHNGIVKLSDFGSATVLADGKLAPSQPRGTTAYSAPELLQNKPITKAVDLWSVGCVLYYLFREKSPFDAVGEARTVDAVTAYCQTPTSVAETIPAAWKEIIDGLLKPNPEEREQLYACLLSLQLLCPKLNKDAAVDTKLLPADKPTWWKDTAEGFKDGVKGFGVFLA